VTDQVSADDDPEEKRRQRIFDRRYRLLELRERRADRAAKLEEVEINRKLKEKEIQANEGSGIKFTSGQATVAVAAIALLSAVLGAAIQGFVTRGVEADKNQALIAVEDLKAKANIALEKQKQEAAEQLDRAKFETTLILKATEAPKREDQIKNLKFFLNAGFIHDPDGKIAKIDESAYPSSPILEAPTPADVYREARPSIGQVEIQGIDGSGQQTVAQGTCFIVTKDGYALTSAHLVAIGPDFSITVRLGSIAASPQQAQVVRLNTEDDIGIIKMVGNIDYKPLRISRQQSSLGDSVAVIGYPVRTDLVILLGSIIMLSDSRGKMEIATPASPGQAGSPVLNKNGGVIGILSGTYADRPTIAIATPVIRAISMLADFSVIPN
jgi:S1-C subfamily serine protease